MLGRRVQMRGHNFGKVAVQIFDKKLHFIFCSSLSSSFCGKIERFLFWNSACRPAHGSTGDSETWLRKKWVGSIIDCDESDVCWGLVGEQSAKIWDTIQSTTRLLCQYTFCFILFSCSVSSIVAFTSRLFPSSEPFCAFSTAKRLTFSIAQRRPGRFFCWHHAALSQAHSQTIVH